MGEKYVNISHTVSYLVHFRILGAILAAALDYGRCQARMQFCTFFGELLSRSDIIFAK